MRRALAIVALVGATAHAQPSTLSPAQALAKVEQTYAKTQQITATFEQTVTNAAFGRTDTRSGKLYLAKPDRMRWDYTKAGSKDADPSFIFDGATLWVVERSKLQVLKNTVQSSSLPAALTFLTGAGKLSKEFDVAAAPIARLVPGATVLELKPKQASAQFAKLYLVIDSTTWQVARSIVVNSNGDETTYGFANVNSNPRLDPKKTFQFDPASVPTFKVIDVAAKRP